MVASASDALAVIPTNVPLAEFSAMLFAVALVSVTDPTSNSSTSVKLIVKLAVEKLVSLEVARTVMVWLVAASKFNRVLLATVTTPVLLLIVKRPPDESSNE